MLAVLVDDEAQGLFRSSSASALLLDPRSWQLKFNEWQKDLPTGARVYAAAPVTARL